MVTKRVAPSPSLLENITRKPKKENDSQKKQPPISLTAMIKRQTTHYLYLHSIEERQTLRRTEKGLPPSKEIKRNLQNEV